MIFRKEEIEFLKDNFPTRGIIFCMNKLSRTYNSIRHYCKRHKIKYTEEYWKLLYKNSVKKQLITKSKIKIVHNVNENDFIKITTPDVAYLLGLLWADGNIYIKDPVYCISISCLLEDMRDVENIFDKTGKWNKYIINQPHRRTQLRITTNNKELCQFLLEHNYKSKSNSSACKILSKIPEHLQHYWFRGLIDGDGCFYFNNKSKELCIASSYEQDWTYILNLCKKLNIDIKIKKTIQLQYNKKNKSSVARLRKIKFIKKFGDYIYQNRETDKIGFYRKYKKYNDLCLNFS